MRILVTGGAGLVGDALQTLVTKAKGVDSWYFVSRQQCDFLVALEVTTLFQRVKPDCVVHLCAKVGGVYANLADNYNFLVDNNTINTNVVDACRKFQVKKLVNVLSTCIFPDDGVNYPLTSEQMHKGLPHCSNMGYAYSKRLLDVMSRLLAEEGVTQVVNLIPTNLYGENDNYNLDNGHVVPVLIHKVYLCKQTDKTLVVKGDGSVSRQFLYAGDLAQVIMNFVYMNTPTTFTSCIVSPDVNEEMTIKQIVGHIAEAFGFNGVVSFDSTCVQGQKKKTTTDIELKHWLPAFQFISFEEGLHKTIQYFMKNYSKVRQ